MSTQSLLSEWFIKTHSWIRNGTEKQKKKIAKKTDKNSLAPPLTSSVTNKKIHLNPGKLLIKRPHYKNVWLFESELFQIFLL